MLATSRCREMISFFWPSSSAGIAKMSTPMVLCTFSPPYVLKGGDGARPSPVSLLSGRQVCVAVALVAVLGSIGAHGTFFTVADIPQAVGRYAQLHQKLHGGGGAPVAQAEIVFGRAALVAVALDYHAEAGIGGEDSLEQIRVPRQRLAGVVAKVALVIVEISV